MDSAPSRFASGPAYGPVLTSTQLFLLQAADGCKCLELHPILNHGLKTFRLVCNLALGQIGGYDTSNSSEDLPFDTHKDEPATIPRVETIYLISRLSPWVTTVNATNMKKGVTLGDLTTAMMDTYRNHLITDAEWNSLGHREQERTRRASLQNMWQEGNASGNAWPNAFSPNMNASQPSKLRRVDWLRERTFYDGMEQDDDYSLKRLGFKAPNIFIINFCA